MKHDHKQYLYFKWALKHSWYKLADKLCNPKKIEKLYIDFIKVIYGNQYRRYLEWKQKNIK